MRGYTAFNNNYITYGYNSDYGNSTVIVKSEGLTFFDSAIECAGRYPPTDKCNHYFEVGANDNIEFNGDVYITNVMIIRLLSFYEFKRLLDGHLQIFHPDSNAIHIKCVYKEGKYDGEYEEYYTNGNIKIKTEYDNGKICGNYTEFYPTGELRIRTHYCGGKIDGEYTEYYRDGTINVKTQYVNGKKIGSYKEYFISGAIKIYTFYLNDKRNGLYREFYYPGELKIEAEYKNGIPYGEHIKYRHDGKITSRVYYENGEISRNILRRIYNFFC